VTATRIESKQEFLSANASQPFLALGSWTRPSIETTSTLNAYHFSRFFHFLEIQSQCQLNVKAGKDLTPITEVSNLDTTPK
jgi:hypothetical protein